MHVAKVFYLALIRSLWSEGIKKSRKLWLPNSIVRKADTCFCNVVSGENKILVPLRYYLKETNSLWQQNTIAGGIKILFVT